jgi:predicted small integral membrane protein
MMLRLRKIFLILSIAAWVLLGALGNIVDWGGTTGAVEAATSMSTFDPVPASGRATSNPAVILLGAVLIPFFKVAAGVLCLLGAWQMWSARGRNERNG